MGQIERAWFPVLGPNDSQALGECWQRMVTKNGGRRAQYFRLVQSHVTVIETTTFLDRSLSV